MVWLARSGSSASTSGMTSTPSALGKSVVASSRAIGSLDPGVPRIRPSLVAVLQVPSTVQFCSAAHVENECHPTSG
jgi:hypothetical protein